MGGEIEWLHETEQQKMSNFVKFQVHQCSLGSDPTEKPVP